MESEQKNYAKQIYRRWALQYALAFPLLLALLATVQYVKGQGLVNALLFGAIWSLFSVVVHGLVRLRNLRKNPACVLGDQGEDS